MTDEKRLSLNLEGLASKERLLYRDGEIEQILFNMKNGINTYIHGSIGIGKTSTIKQVIKRFNSSQTKALYVNCAIFQKQYGILQEVINQINQNFTQTIFIQTRSNSDLIRRLKTEKGRRFQSLKVVVLDHLQRLEEGEVVDCLFEIGFTVILVSDEEYAKSKISQLSQRHFASTIEFKNYSHEQITRILKTKARNLLGENSFTENCVEKIAKICEGDISDGEKFLLGSAVMACSKKKKFVDVDDVPEVEEEKGINHDENKLVEILKEKHSMASGELYQEYCKRVHFPKTERTFRNFMKHLSEKNLVRAIGTTRGRVYEIIEKNDVVKKSKVVLI